MLDSEFIKDIKALCEATGMNLAQVTSELEKMFGEEVIVSFFITYGSSPLFPNNLGEVFALSEQCLYDYEIAKDGARCHTFFLDSISEITEESSEVEFLDVHFHSSAGVGLVLIEKKDKKNEIRRFCTEVKGKILARRR